MTVKDLVAKIEHVYGRKSHKYIMQLMNEGLDEISHTAKMNSQKASEKIVPGQRWYKLADAMVDIKAIEIISSDGEWIGIPRLTSNPNIGDDE